MARLTVVTNSAKETESLGERLAPFLKPGDVLALTGELGSGKTTFTKGIAKGLEVARCEYVNSPSFVLVKEYKGRINLYHLDLYRLDKLYEIEYIGLQEYLDGDGIVVIEWAEKLDRLLPKEYLAIFIDIIDKDKRGFSFKADGERFNTIIRRYLKQQV